MHVTQIIKVKDWKVRSMHMLPHFFPVLPYGKHCLQRSFLFPKTLYVKENYIFPSHFVVGFSILVPIHLNSIIKIMNAHVFLWIVHKNVECKRFQERRYSSSTLLVCNFKRPWYQSLLSSPRVPPPPGGGLLGSTFAGYVSPASQNPYPIIVYSVAKL